MAVSFGFRAGSLALGSGGGGLSPQIETDMNNVLNKKMGTSGQTYPPSEWASDVNLMGLLEEKTASGSVAAITDGADGVPLKNWGVTVDPTLSGVSSVVCTQAGKNFLDPSIVFENTTIYTYDSVTGAVTVLKSDSSAWNAKTELPLKAGTYAITNPTGRFHYRLASESYGTDHNINATTGTITLSADDGIKIKFGLGTTYPFTASYQLERNSTATTFEKYTAPTVSTVNLGRTIYGGSADVVTGEGTDENGNDFTFTPITPTPETALGTNNFWGDTGDSEVVYRSSGTVMPTLISKSITENGTYSAEDDHCDGYSQVTVQVPAGRTFPSTLSFTEIATDTNSSGTLTFTDDYHNYALLKVRMYNPSNQATEEVICTPRFIDDAFQYSNNRANFNFVGTDKYAYYGAGQNNTWVRGGYRDICVSAVFGVTSSTHNIITTTIHRYQSINSGNNEIFFLESTYDYDYFAISICDGDSTETQPSFQLVTAGKGGFNDFSQKVLVSGYNSLRNFIIEEHKMADASGSRFGFFTVEGITFEEITT